MITNNVINAYEVGIAKYNGSSVWDATTATQYNVLIGSTSNAITNIAPSSTTGIPLVSQGASANPAFSTAIVAGGGTGVSSFNANSIVLTGATSTGALTSAALTNGQLIIGSTGAAPVAANLTPGPNISITNAAGGITITGVFSWIDISSATYTVTSNNSYFTSYSGAADLYLPSSPALGDHIQIENKGSGSFNVHPSGTQTICYLSYTISNPNYLTCCYTVSTSNPNPNAAINLVYDSATLTWNALSNEGPFYFTIASPYVSGIVYSLSMLLLKNDGSAWACGSNTYGQLGTQNNYSYSSPVKVVGNFSFSCTSSSGQAPHAHSLGISNNGSAWAWGDNAYGQLGTLNPTSYSSPVSVVGNHTFTQIMATTAASYALKTDGTCWAWGLNGNGELGNLSKNSYSSPISVVGNHSFIQFTSGIAAAYGLKADGTCWAWGYNGYGELGNQSPNDYSSPISVKGNHAFIQIASCGYYCLGLKGNGESWAWGNDDEGELGQGTTTARYSSPVSVVGYHSFVQIMGAFKSCYGRKANGEVWAWGYNDFGQLGTGNTTSYSSPVKVAGGYAFTNLFNSTCSVSKSVGSFDASGKFYTWGDDTYGQLGILSLNNASIPTIVFNSSNSCIGQPSWALVAQTQVLTPVASVSLNLAPGYNEYILQWEGVLPAATNKVLQMQVSFDQGATYLATNYDSFEQTCNGAGVVGVSTSTTYVYLAIDVYYNSLDTTNGIIYMHNFSTTGHWAMYGKSMNYVDNAYEFYLASFLNQGGFVNNIKIYFNSGNITSGNFRIYGVI